MLDDQVTAKICIPKIIFNICDARKMGSDEVFLYIPVYDRFSRLTTKSKNDSRVNGLII